MKKKLAFIMALSLCLSMGMSAMTSCSGDSDSLKDDEIMAKVREAVLASMAYDGAWTANVSQSYENLSSNEQNSHTEEAVTYLSVDPATGSMYQELTEGENITVSKMFKIGDTYYSYAKMPSEDEESKEPVVEEEYKMLTEAYATYEIENCTMDLLLEEMSMTMMLETYLDVESVSEFNAAMKTVNADMIAALPEGTTGTSEMKIVCKENKGSNVVEIVSKSETTIVQAGVTQKTVMNGTYSFTEKDGKLTTFAVNMEGLIEMTMPAMGENSEPVTQKQGYSSEIACEFAYTFDQATYDGLVMTLPEDLEVEEQYNKNFNVVINGIENENKAYGSGETLSAAIEYAYSDAVSSLENKENVDIVWYKDEACTQAIDVETLTSAEYYAIDTLYGKATLKDGYAFVIEEETMVAADNLSKAYKIYFNMMASVQNGGKTLRVVEAGEFYFYESTTIYLNGTATTAESFTAESGKTYNIEYREVYEKEDIIGSSM